MYRDFDGDEQQSLQRMANFVVRVSQAHWLDTGCIDHKVAVLLVVEIQMGIHG
jgi:hypothetical protein